MLSQTLQIDQEFRHLASIIPYEWWAKSSGKPGISHVLQYLYGYLVVRTHVIIAIRQDPEGKYAYNRTACTQASQNVVQRYVQLRGMYPPGSHVGRVLGVQAQSICCTSLIPHMSTAAEMLPVPPRCLGNF